MKHANDFVVGAVVLGVSVALIGAVLWVQQADVGQREQHVVARFRDVGNARIGNAAVIRGVRGGHIDALELAPDGWVHVRLSIDRDVRLPRDPVVLLNESHRVWEAALVIAGAPLVWQTLRAARRGRRRIARWTPPSGEGAHSVSEPPTARVQ
jgi:hypothetical protein